MVCCTLLSLVHPFDGPLPLMRPQPLAGMCARDELVSQELYLLRWSQQVSYTVCSAGGVTWAWRARVAVSYSLPWGRSATI